MSEGPKSGVESRPRSVVKSYVTYSPSATEEFGERLAEGLSAGSVVALRGELGAGKTVLARGIARGLGVGGYLKSPSFTIVNEYSEGRVPLYHIDLYRLPEGASDASSNELAGELGLEEYLYGDGVCVIEWAERAASLIPQDALRVTITYGAQDGEGASAGEPMDKKEEIEDSEEETGADAAPRTLVVSFYEYGNLCHGEDWGYS